MSTEINGLSLTFFMDGHSWIGSIWVYRESDERSMKLTFRPHGCVLWQQLVPEPLYESGSQTPIVEIFSGPAKGIYPCFGIRHPLIGRTSGGNPLIKNWERFVPVIEAALALEIPPSDGIFHYGEESRFNPRGYVSPLLEVWKQYGTGSYMKYPATPAGLFQAVHEHYYPLPEDSPRFQAALSRLNELLTLEEVGEVIKINGGYIAVIDGGTRAEAAAAYYRPVLESV